MDGCCMKSCCNMGWITTISKLLKQINCSINNIPTTDTANIERMLAHNNPMTIAGEYPHEEDGRFVVSTPVRFLDMLNTDMYVIFKIDNNSSNLPVYFADAVNYQHAIVLPDNTPVLVNQLQLNGIYKAKYQYSASCIILDSLTPLNPDIITI